MQFLPPHRAVPRKELVFSSAFEGVSHAIANDSRLAQQKGNTMSFGLYAIGFGILIMGLIYGAFLMHLPARWIVVGAIVLVGAGILSGVKATRQKDTAS
jgi:hypothetical protein